MAHLHFAEFLAYSVRVPLAMSVHFCPHGLVGHVFSRQRCTIPPRDVNAERAVLVVLLEPPPHDASGGSRS